jgi:flagellar FliL protein
MAASASEEKAESTAANAGAPSGGGNKLVTLLSIVNSLAVVGMIAILFVSFQRDKKRPSVDDVAARAQAPAAKEEKKEGEGESKGEEGKEGAKKTKADFGKMVTLEQFTVNLSTPGSVNPKFVRVNISIEVPTEDLENEVNAKMPQVRNVIIDLFNSKRPADLATADEREYLKEEIKNAINGFMIHGKVNGVFFTNFALSG